MADPLAVLSVVVGLYFVVRIVFFALRIGAFVPPDAMVRPGRDRLNGCVEVDETYVGGEEEGVRGRQTEDKAIVVVAAEQDGGGSAASGSDGCPTPRARVCTH